MIETESSRKKSEVDRIAAKEYLRSKFGLKTAAEIAPPEQPLSCPICEQRKQKGRDRVKRYRSKSK